MRPRSVRLSLIMSLTLVVLFLVFGARLWAGEFRNWTDATGKFTISAKLVEEKEGKIVLKKEDGTEITLSVERLSSNDQKYLASQRTPAAEKLKPATLPINDVKDIPRLREIAEEFYEDLRTEARDVARGLMTDASQKLADDGESPLAGLPAPDNNPKAIRVGKAKVTGKSAAVSVVMLIKGEALRTTLHLRKVDDQWQVFGVSAKLGSNEVTVNLETRVEKPSANEPTGPRREPLEALVGQPIELSGLTLNGKTVSLSQYKGKVVLIDFWATWCGPCLGEIPNIATNYQRYNRAGFEVIAVSVDKDLDELTEFVAKENPPWVVLADSHPRNTTSMSAKFGINGIPAFILVGKDGKVAAVNCRGEKLGLALATLLQ